jgi:hypothetical protein
MVQGGGLSVATFEVCLRGDVQKIEGSNGFT